MDIRPITTEKQFRKALAEVSRLVELDPEPKSTEGAPLELLAQLVEDYEKARFPFDTPDPIEA